MGRPCVVKQVNQTNLAATAIGGTQPSPTIIQNGYPVGDTIYKKMNISWDGTLSLTASSAGTIVTRGGLNFLRQIIFETDKHGKIIDGLDGTMIHQMLTVRNGARPPNTDIASADTGAPTWRYALEFPFYDEDAARPEDSGLDMYASRPTLTIQPGLGTTDWITGGTYSTQTCDAARQEISVDVDPTPVDIVNDGPLVMPYWGVRREPISAAATQYQIILPFGDRWLKRLFVTQRNGSTRAELSNTIIGAANTDRLSLKVNGLPWYDNVQWLQLQDENAVRYRLSSMPTGVGVLDFVRKRARGFLYGNALNLVSNVQGVCELLVDCASVSNGQLWLGYECVKPIPAAALRPRPAPAASAA